MREPRPASLTALYQCFGVKCISWSFASYEYRASVFKNVLLVPKGCRLVVLVTKKKRIDGSTAVVIVAGSVAVVRTYTSYSYNLVTSFTRYAWYALYVRKKRRERHALPSYRVVYQVQLSSYFLPQHIPMVICWLVCSMIRSLRSYRSSSGAGIGGTCDRQSCLRKSV